MPADTKYFSRNLFQTITVLLDMARPKGTSIQELCRELRLNRRSIFRILKTIEQDLKIPVIVRRETFGGTAVYRLSPAFIEKLSNVTLPALPLSFSQALVVYLLLKGDSFPKTNKADDGLEGLLKSLKSVFDG
jgi:hypothetical protein